MSLSNRSLVGLFFLRFMMVYIVWFALLTITALITKISEKKITPILMQFILVFLFLFLGYKFFPVIDLSLKDVVNKEYVKYFYTINVTLIIGYILTDISHFKCSTKPIVLGLISFIIPFVLGLISALYLFSYDMNTALLVGLLYSIIAVPVLYIFLKNFNYNQERTTFLIQVAISIDIIAWLIFALMNKNDSIYITILAGLLPLLLRLFVSNNKVYSYLFFIMLFICNFIGLNIILFGVVYMICMSFINIKCELPIKDKIYLNYQNYIAIPFILLYGVFQINLNSIQNINITLLIYFILTPILFKIVANYIGLSFVNNELTIKNKLKESVLLNTRGLTEIIFLNLLFQKGLINDELYIIFMIMSLLSTFIPLLILKKEL